VSQAALPANDSADFRFGAPAAFVAGFLLLVITALSWHLWPEWAHNPDLSHGIFTPIICLVLAGESRRQGPRRWLPDEGPWLLLPAGLTCTAVVLFGLAGLLAASVGWEHALVDFLLAAATSSALLAGLVCLAGRRTRAVPFNWISLTAAGIWLLASPLPNGTYTRVTLELQGWISGGVMHGLHLLGIPAHRHGNIIELARTSVGVEEACSGIRSLLSCLYAGCFFAAWRVRTVAGRVLLIGLAPVLAIAMNFVRSFTLTLLANAGIKIEGLWHDVTGYAVLGLTSVILAVLAVRLGRKRPPDMPLSGAASTAPAATGFSWSFGFFGVGALGAVLLAVFFGVYGPSGARSVPAELARADVTELLPVDAAGWSVETTGGLRQFSGVLRTTQLVERTYRKNGAEGQPIELIVYVAHWEPGQAPVSLVASHTPDACWPGAGWVVQPVADPQVVLRLADRELPRAEHRIFQNPPAPPQQVWFWHVYDGHVISYRDPYSVSALLELAWRYGFRREGGQYFVRLSSNRPWDQLANEPLLRQISANLSRIGLIP